MPHAQAPKVDDEELQLHPFFAELDRAQRDGLRAGARALALAPGERVFEMGQPADRFWLVRSGRVKLYRVASSGAEKVVEVMGPGQTFAEAVMFMAVREYPVNAEALVDTEVIGFDADRFLALLRGSPETCLKLLGGLSMRLHRRINEIEALSFQNATLRVISFLANSLPPPGSAPVIRLEVQKKVLASRLSVQPETLSRVLHALGEQGVIEVDGAEIRVRDAARLRALATEG